MTVLLSFGVGPSSQILFPALKIDAGGNRSLEQWKKTVHNLQIRHAISCLSGDWTVIFGSVPEQKLR